LLDTVSGPHTRDRAIASPLLRGTGPESLGAIIQNFKSQSTALVNRLRLTPGRPLWQRNYHEHIIRNEIELNNIREYISLNPGRWADDTYNPANAQAGQAT
jgi:hypothetical protein